MSSIEECLPFWVDHLGFQKEIEVPHGGALGFVSLTRDGFEVMLQSVASVKEDLPDAGQSPNRSFLFVEVTSLAELEPGIAKLDKLFERRQTFYGATETCLRDPEGNLITLAEFAAR